MAECTKVIVRFRPQNKLEKSVKGHICIKISPDKTLCEIENPKAGQPAVPFVFDKCFGVDTPQAEVYEHAASHLVKEIFEGFNATIFAYGQTGAGKTYSMEGKLGSPHRGIVPRVVENIFETISDADDEQFEFILQVSYVEIYLEMLRDLLHPTNTGMKIRDSASGVYIEGVTEMYVRDAQEVIDLMTMGAGNRTVAGTNMNAVSSRSHGVFMLKLISTNTQTGSKKISKLTMVDLAGSVKVDQTGPSSGQTLEEEEKQINHDQSLSTLGNVLNSLSSGKGHVAYHDSVLTSVLSDSLGGDCKTTLLIACSSSSYNAQETIAACEFGTGAKKMKNKVQINGVKTVEEYKKELAAANGKIANLNRLCGAYKMDLAKAQKGLLKEGDQGIADRLLEDEKKKGKQTEGDTDLAPKEMKESKDNEDDEKTSISKTITNEKTVFKVK